MVGASDTSHFKVECVLLGELLITHRHIDLFILYPVSCILLRKCTADICFGLEILEPLSIYNIRSVPYGMICCLLVL